MIPLKWDTPTRGEDIKKNRRINQPQLWCSNTFLNIIIFFYYERDPSKNGTDQWNDSLIFHRAWFNRYWRDMKRWQSLTSPSIMQAHPTFLSPIKLDGDADLSFGNPYDSHLLMRPMVGTVQPGIRPLIIISKSNYLPTSYPFQTSEY